MTGIGHRWVDFPCNWHASKYSWGANHEVDRWDNCTDSSLFIIYMINGFFLKNNALSGTILSWRWFEGNPFSFLAGNISHILFIFHKFSYWTQPCLDQRLRSQSSTDCNIQWLISTEWRSIHPMTSFESDWKTAQWNYIKTICTICWKLIF